MASNKHRVQSQGNGSLITWYGTRIQTWDAPHFTVNSNGSMHVMNKQILRASFLFLLLAALTTSCITPAGSNAKDEVVVWKGTRAYARKVDAFKVNPHDALKLALEEMEKPGAPRLRHRGILGEAEFIVGNWYWFGQSTKIELDAGGYFVNGEDGKIEFRESDKRITSRIRKLSTATWRQTTPLRGNGG